MFHCRPSELAHEDGLLLLELMDIKHWRDAALHYDSDPKTQMVSSEEKMRFLALSFGIKDALTADVETLGPRIKESQRNPVDPDWWKLSKAKQTEIGKQAQALNNSVNTATPTKVMGR